MNEVDWSDVAASDIHAAECKGHTSPASHPSRSFCTDHKQCTAQASFTPAVRCPSHMFPSLAVHAHRSVAKSVWGSIAWVGWILRSPWMPEDEDGIDSLRWYILRSWNKDMRKVGAMERVSDTDSWKGLESQRQGISKGSSSGIPGWGLTQPLSPGLSSGPLYKGSINCYIHRGLCIRKDLEGSR